MEILDGKKVAQKIADELKTKVSSMKVKPRLDIIKASDDYGTTLYVNMKKRKGEEIGIEAIVHEFNSDVTTDELVSKINEISKETNGILVQLPLPERVDKEKVLNSVPVNLDVDGLNSINLGKLKKNEPDAIPSATALGVITLLKRYNIELKGKKVCVIGNSVTVGRPLSALFNNEGSVVSVCDINTPNTKEISKECDVVAVATGNPKLVKRDWLKEEAIVIDIGINRDEQGNLVGDVDFDDVKDIVSYITPVPGGVGPMTIISLLWNVVEACS